MTFEKIYITHYKGWEISSFYHHGKLLYRAYKWGVSMNTDNTSDLISMIDYKEESTKIPSWRQA